MRMNFVIFGMGKFNQFRSFLLAHRVNCMRHHHKLHTFRFALVIFQKFDIRRPSFWRHQRFCKRNANRRTDSHFFDNAHRLFAMPIHVRKKHRSRLDHFENCKAATNSDVVRREFCFCRPNVFVEPFAKFHVVSKTAQQAHRCMRVAVIERWHNCKMRTIDNFSTFVIIRF